MSAAVFGSQLYTKFEPEVLKPLMNDQVVSFGFSLSSGNICGGLLIWCVGVYRHLRHYLKLWNPPIRLGISKRCHSISLRILGSCWPMSMLGVIPLHSLVKS